MISQKNRQVKRTHTHTHTHPYRGVLTLHGGAVKAQRGNSVLVSLDGQQTFVAPLSRLRLREVLCPQSDRLHHVDGHEDPFCRQQLGTSLEEREEEEGKISVTTSLLIRFNA